MELSSPGKQFLSGPQFLASPQKKRKWLIEPIIPVSGIVNLFGKPKTGKSQASLGMGLAIASGLSEWNGFAVRTHGPVMYLQLDTPEGEMFDRIDAISKTGFDTTNLFFADLSIAPYPYNIMLPQHQTWLRNEIERIQPVMVFIDTLREAHERNENDSTDMKLVANALVKIIRPAAIGLISHSRKDSIYAAMGADQDIMDEGRGSSYISGRMDTVFRFTGNPGKTHGYMTYKGRSKNAEGKMKIVLDPDSGLPEESGDEAEKMRIVADVYAKHKDSKSINEMAEMIASKKVKGLAKRTAQKYLTDLHKELEDKAN